MADTWIQRKNPKGAWVYDSLYLGPNSREVAERALEHHGVLNPHIEFRIAPERQPATFEEIAERRFKDKPHKSDKWVMGESDKGYSGPS